jgi:Tol biopolymer transport system component
MGSLGLRAGRKRRALALALVGVSFASVLAADASAQIPSLEGRLAFVKGQYSGTTSCCDSAIFTIDPDGTDPARITPNRGSPAGDGFPRYSPEGLRIAYVARECYSPPPAGRPCLDAEIYVMLADGSFPTLLTYERDIIVGGIPPPAWAPTGTKIAYEGVGPAGNDLDIYETRLAGLGTENLTKSAEFVETKPEYSPDGRQIAFIGSPRVPFDPEIYVMDADGSDRRAITHGLQPGPMSWSPDGRRIAFSADVTESGAMFGVGSDIFTIGVDGQDLVRLADGRGYDHFPSYSPDGRRVAFTTDRHHPQPNLRQNDVFVMDADGSNPVNVSNDPSMTDGAPDWGSILSGAIAPLPVPPIVIDLCPEAETKLVIPGTALDQQLRGSPGPDVLLSGRPGDGSIGAGGADCLFARGGQDRLAGGAGNDVLSGGPGPDHLRCGPGSKDLAVADREDAVAESCERVR